MIAPKYDRQPARRRTIGEESKRQVNAQRAGVLERDRYMCVAASLGGCMGDLTMQHRAAKQAGGSALYDGAGFLVAMCWGHNVREMQDADLRRKFIANGWSVAKWMVEPNLHTGVPIHDISEIPLLYPDGRWYRNFNQSFGQAFEPDGVGLMVRLGIRSGGVHGQEVVF
ncbi:hypothetical protein KPL76_06285 [Subtercola sp. PAMC28395]|uniref:hypothetical protein n=1 Tax=Subtercola sp. PAMC28395 TaxID=2846775 RepID=UPI001C0CA9BD|nr:hypothetical protein [Subtercola sp. PAMC28395]QWT24962.1 hypothetical protein KPL76_06285 [Subtercola sp. PAMC28395]